MVFSDGPFRLKKRFKEILLLDSRDADAWVDDFDNEFTLVFVLFTVDGSRELDFSIRATKLDSVTHEVKHYLLKSLRIDPDLGDGLAQHVLVHLEADLLLMSLLREQAQHLLDELLELGDFDEVTCHLEGLALQGTVIDEVVGYKLANSLRNKGVQNGFAQLLGQLGVATNLVKHLDGLCNRDDDLVAYLHVQGLQVLVPVLSIFHLAFELDLRDVVQE
jgi:hypothetical protein